jgi:hypothetical protein
MLLLLLLLLSLAAGTLSFNKHHLSCYLEYSFLVANKLL